MRGSGRPARRAAARISGTRVPPSARGPVIQVSVPSASSPAMRRMSGPRPPISTGQRLSVFTESEAFTRYWVPWKFALPVSSSCLTTVTYSRMCRAGCAYESPSRFSITSWWLGPRPRTKRPRAAACVESACCAMYTGWRECVGATAVPISTARVSRPTRAARVMASKPKMFANQRVAKPASSARWQRATSSSMLAPPPSPIPSPIRMFFMSASEARAYQ